MAKGRRNVRLPIEQRLVTGASRGLWGDLRFAVTTWGMAKLLQLQSARHPAFRGQLRRHDLTLQLKLLDDSLGRVIRFRGGRVSSRRGVQADADVVMGFRDTAVAARVLRPKRDRLEFLNAAKNSQLIITTDLVAKYPLQLMTPHPRYSFHTHHDGKHGALNDLPDHRVLVGGRHHWIARLNPGDAQARGVRDNDLVRLYNDRGGVICAARLTERVRPGVVHSYESSAVYEPLGAPGRSDDQGGCVNLLTPSRMMIERSHSLAAGSCLVQVERWNA